MGLSLQKKLLVLQCTLEQEIKEIKMIYAVKQNMVVNLCGSLSGKQKQKTIKLEKFEVYEGWYAGRNKLTKMMEIQIDAKNIIKIPFNLYISEKKLLEYAEG